GRIMHSLWGGPPGARGSPWTRSSVGSEYNCGKAGQGAGCGPEGPPHNECRVSPHGKTTRALIWFAFSAVSFAQNWPQFRGEHAAGVADAQNLPSSWNTAW